MKKDVYNLIAAFTALSVLLWPFTTYAAVAYDSQKIYTAAHTWVACNPTCTYTHTIVADDNTTVFIYVINGNNAVHPYQVLFDGGSTTMAGYKNRFDNAQAVFTFYATVSGTGNKTVSVQWPANNPYTHMISVAYTGTDTASPFEGFTGASNSSVSVGVTTTVSVSDNSWLAGAWFDASGNAGGHIAGYNTTFRATGSFVGGMDSNAAMTPAGNYTLSALVPGKTAFWITNAFGVKPTSGGGGATPTVDSSYFLIFDEG